MNDMKDPGRKIGPFDGLFHHHFQVLQVHRSQLLCFGLPQARLTIMRDREGQHRRGASGRKINQLNGLHRRRFQIFDCLHGRLFCLVLLQPSVMDASGGRSIKSVAARTATSTPFSTRLAPLSLRRRVSL
jgi:hypothetical protein